MKHEGFNWVIGTVSIIAMLGVASPALAGKPVPTPTPAAGYCSTNSATEGITTGDVKYKGSNAADCYGVVTSSNINGASDLNTLGLTWGSDWTYLDGSDSNSGTYKSLQFTVTTSIGTTGSWLLTATDGNTSTGINLPAKLDLAVALKAGNEYALWYYNDVAFDGSDGGSWSVQFTNGGGQHPALSHIMVFGRDGQTAPVPVPAAAWLLGSGLIGLAGIGRRKIAA